MDSSILIVAFLIVPHNPLSGKWSGVTPRATTETNHVFAKDWTAYSKSNNHSNLKSQHNHERFIYDHSTSTRILTLIINKILMYIAPQIARKWLWASFGYAKHLVLAHVFHILRHMGLVGR